MSANRLLNPRLATQSLVIIVGFVLAKDVFLRGFYSLFHAGPTGVLMRLPRALYRLPEDGTLPYEGWSIFLAAMRCPMFAWLFLGGSVVSFLFYRRLRWSAYGPIPRAFMGVAAIVMAWAYSAYGYNFYVDQAHLFDRILLVALCVAVFLHPAFVVPFFALALLIMSQFGYPMEGYSLTDKQLPLHCFFLFIAFHGVNVGKQLLRAVGKKSRSWRRRKARPASVGLAIGLILPRWLLVGLNGKVFLILLLTMIGAEYLVPAMHKVAISPSGTEWLLQNGLDRHIAGSIFRNNHFFFSEGGGDTALPLGQRFGTLLCIATMVLELGALVILVHHRLAAIVLLAFAMLHIGICALSGIFFWKWIILDVALAILVLRPEARGVFTRQSFVISLLVMFTASYHFAPTALGWFDTGLVSTYRFTVTTADDEVFELKQTSMKPYGLYLIFERYHFINPQKRLGRMHVTQSYSLADEIKRADVTTITRKMKAEGDSRFNESMARKFDAFIIRYFEHWNRRLDRRLIPFDWVAAPPHILSGDSRNAFGWDRAVKGVDIHYKTGFYDGKETHLLNDALIRQIKIPTTEDPKAPNPNTTKTAGPELGREE